MWGKINGSGSERTRRRPTRRLWQATFGTQKQGKERIGLVYAWWIGMVWSKGALGYPDTWGNVKFFENLQKFSFLLLTFLPTLLQ